MALIRFRSATWHKGWYYCGTFSIQPLPLPISVFAHRDRWWNLARAPDSGHLSSTAALLHHGDALFLDQALARRSGRSGSGSGSGSRGGGGGCMDASAVAEGKRAPQTMHGLLYHEGAGQEDVGAAEGGGNSVASSLSALEQYGEPFALGQDGRGGGGSSSGSRSDGEEQDVVFVPGQWPRDSEWPRLERTRLLLPAPEAAGASASASGSSSSSSPSSSSSSSAGAGHAAHQQQHRQQHQQGTSTVIAAPGAAISSSSSIGTSSISRSTSGGRGGARRVDGDKGPIYRGRAPARLRLEEVNTMASGAWAPGGAALPPFPRHFEVPEPPQQGVGEGEEKKCAPRAAARGAAAAATAATAAAGGAAGRGRGGDVAVLTASTTTTTTMQQSFMAVPADWGGGTYQPAPRARPSLLPSPLPSPSLSPGPQQPPSPSSMFYHHQLHRQRMQAMAVGNGGVGAAGGGCWGGGEGSAGGCGDGAVMVPAASMGSPTSGFGGGEEGLDDKLLDLLYESPLVFDGVSSFQGGAAATGAAAVGASAVAPAMPQPLAGAAGDQGLSLQQQMMYYHYQQPAPPASMAGGQGQTGPMPAAVGAAWASTEGTN